jgi:hypothetical protein
MPHCEQNTLPSGTDALQRGQVMSIEVVGSLETVSAARTVRSASVAAPYV